MVQTSAPKEVQMGISVGQALRKLKGLAFEFGRLLFAAQQCDGHVELVQMAMRAQVLQCLGVETHVLAARGQAHRLKLVHAAATHQGVNRRRAIPLLLPVGGT